LGSSRIFIGLSFGCACIVAGCGNLIGLGDYSVADATAGNSGAGAGGNIGRSGANGGSAGQDLGEGGTSGASDDNAAAGASGAAETAGAAGDGGSAGASGSAGNGASAGVGGAPASCPAGCDDSNDCTIDRCVSGACVNEPLAVGAACGVARSCDDQAVCVRCRDTAAGTAQDFGCSSTAPICLGTGLDAACAGCTTATDCNDGNECTSEACSAGKCVFAPVAAGSACSGGVCNGTSSAEKCVACANTASGSAQDAGCTSANPVCDASGTPTCYQCLTNTDCATDNVSCTVETCSNHLCSHVATDSLCSSSNDVCKPNKCNVTLDCKQVDISLSKPVIGLGSSQGNGGFEAQSGSSAAGWADVGGYIMIYNCASSGTPPGPGCPSSNGTTYTHSTGGDYLAWLGGTKGATVTGIDHLIVLPPGSVKLQVVADINFQTKSTSTSNKDYIEVRLLKSDKGQVGSALYAASNANAQTGSARAWTKDVALGPAVDVSAYAAAHPGEDSYVSFWSSVDSSNTTDFFIDNVRVTATVCQ